MHHAVTMHQDSNASLPSNAFATNWRNCLGIGTVTCHVKQRLGLHVQWLLCLLFWCLKSRTNIRSTWVFKKSRKILVCEAGGQIITASPPSGKKKWSSPKRGSVEMSSHWKNCSSCYWNCDFWFLRDEKRLVDHTCSKKKHILKGIHLSKSKRLSQMYIWKILFIMIIIVNSSIHLSKEVWMRNFRVTKFQKCLKNRCQERIDA